MPGRLVTGNPCHFAASANGGSFVYTMVVYAGSSPRQPQVPGYGGRSKLNAFNAVNNFPLRVVVACELISTKSVKEDGVWILPCRFVPCWEYCPTITVDKPAVRGVDLVVVVHGKADKVLVATH